MAKYGGEQSAEKRIEAAGVDIARLHSFIHDRALLEEKHPRSDGSADGGENQQENFVATAAGKRHPREHGVADGVPIGTRENRRGNKKAVENGEAERDSFPGPIAAGGDGGDDDDERAAYGDRRTHAEKAQAGAYADELRDQSEKISEDQIAHGEKAPEFSEAIEDEFGVAAMSDGAEAHRHFLHDESHHKSEHDERNEKADAVARAVRGIGKHAGSVVLTEENEHSGADQKPQQAEAPERFGTPFRSGARHFPAVASAIHVFVGDETDQFRRCGGRHGGFAWSGGPSGQLQETGIFVGSRP